MHTTKYTNDLLSDTEISPRSGYENGTLRTKGSKRKRFDDQDTVDQISGDELSDIESLDYQNRGDKINEDADEGVQVPIAEKSDMGGRIYNKVQCCFFCEKLLKMKISRHMKSVHQKEFETYVSQLDCDEQMSLQLLKNKGNFFHNVNVLRHKKGELIVVRRPTEKVCYKDYLPCPKCLGFFSRMELWRHKASCEAIPTDESKANEYMVDSKTFLYSSVNMSHKDVLTNVVDCMRKDDLYMAVKNDATILMYGSFIFENKGVNYKHTISERMRGLARLVIQLRKETGKESGCLTDFIAPNFFEAILSATKTVCGYGFNKENDKITKIPSLALKLGHALKRCAVLKQGMGLSKQDPSLIKSAKEFMTLFGIHWTNSISSTALRSLGDNKFTKTTQLPLTEDLLKLKRYLADDTTLMIRKLDAGAELEDWRQLAENTVVRILVFNKKRCNEAAKVTLKLYKEMPDFIGTELDDIKKSLQPLETLMCKRYVNLN